jgi:hypothetical protein
MKPFIWGSMGVLACLVTFDVANWIKPIASILPEPLLLLLFIVLAVGAWLAKTRVKLAYGVWELYVGLFALGAAAQKAPITDSGDPLQRNLFFVALVGGIFLIVRGVEDCREAFPEAERAFEKWALKAEHALKRWRL